MVLPRPNFSKGFGLIGNFNNFSTLNSRKFLIMFQEYNAKSTKIVFKGAGIFLQRKIWLPCNSQTIGLTGLRHFFVLDETYFCEPKILNAYFCFQGKKFNLYDLLYISDCAQFLVIFSQIAKISSTPCRILNKGRTN